MVSKFMEVVFTDGDQNTLFNKIIANNKQMAATASYILKEDFLNSNQKLFSNKPNGLQPLAGDIVAVCKDEPRLGLITAVTSPHRVVVRHRHRGTNTEVTYHPKILSPLYRPSSSTFFVQLVENPN